MDSSKPLQTNLSTVTSVTTASQSISGSLLAAVTFRGAFSWRLLWLIRCSFSTKGSAASNLSLVEILFLYNSDYQYQGADIFEWVFLCTSQQRPELRKYASSGVSETGLRNVNVNSFCSICANVPALAS